MWPCSRLTEQQIQEVLESTKNHFHKNTKQVASLTPAQCDKALSDAVDTLNQVKKKGQRTLKKNQVLRGEIADACSKLKELQGLKEDKVQVSLRFAEEWRYVTNQLIALSIGCHNVMLDLHNHLFLGPDSIRTTHRDPRSL